MRVLIVANHNTGRFVPFIVEQVEALSRHGIEFDFYGVHGKGVKGYLSNVKGLRAKIRQFRPNLIHAHYGLSGLLANLQRMTPVITTYHGSDIHAGGLNLFYSRLSIKLSAYNIFVSEQLQKQAGYGGSNQCVLPCGIDTTTFYQIERHEARQLLGWNVDGIYVIFAGAFDNPVKNSTLAKAATAKVKDAQLVEMRGFSREQVNLVLNAANCLLMTSLREGSPQVVKEALSCGIPIVSVNVGDVAEMTAGIDGCYITANDVNDIASHIENAIVFHGKTHGRERIIQRKLDNEQIVNELLPIYQRIGNKSL